MIYHADGQAVQLDSVIDVKGKKYTITDIDGDVIIATSKFGGMKRRFNCSELGMTSSQGGDKKRRKAIDARIKLRDYWED